MRSVTLGAQKDVPEIDSSTFPSNCYRFPSRNPAILFTPVSVATSTWNPSLSTRQTHRPGEYNTKQNTEAHHQTHDPCRGLCIVHTVCLHSLIGKRLQPVTRRRRSPATTVGAPQCVSWGHVKTTVAAAFHFTSQNSRFRTNERNSNLAPHTHSIAANVRAYKCSWVILQLTTTLSSLQSSETQNFQKHRPPLANYRFIHNWSLGAFQPCGQFVKVSVPVFI